MKFSCPICGKVYEIPGQLSAAETGANCCEHFFGVLRSMLVETESAAPVEETPSNGSLVMAFRCPKCKNVLSMPTQTAPGTQINCPCGQVLYFEHFHDRNSNFKAYQLSMKAPATVPV